MVESMKRSEQLTRNRNTKLLGGHYAGHSSLGSGTRQSSGWEAAVTLAQHSFLRAGDGKTAQVRNPTDEMDLVSSFALGWGREVVAWTLGW